jgi:hypothetical protein
MWLGCGLGMAWGGIYTIWLGGPRIAKKMKPPKPRPSPPPSKTVLNAEKWLLNCMREQARFSNFDLVFVWGGGVTKSLKNTSWGQNF